MHLEGVEGLNSMSTLCANFEAIQVLQTMSSHFMQDRNLDYLDSERAIGSCMGVGGGLPLSMRQRYNSAILVS